MLSTDYDNVKQDMAWRSVKVDALSRGAILSVARKINSYFDQNGNLQSLSVEKLASMLDITCDTIAKWESGRAKSPYVQELALNYRIPVELLSPTLRESMKLSMEKGGDCLQQLFEYYKLSQRRACMECINGERVSADNLKELKEKEKFFEDRCRIISLFENSLKEEYYSRIIKLYKGNNQLPDYEDYKSYISEGLSGYNIQEYKDSILTICKDIPSLKYDMIKLIRYQRDNHNFNWYVTYVLSHTLVANGNVKFRNKTE